MSELIQTKSVQELNQEMGPVKASQILRNAKNEQCFGSLNDGKGRYCAFGTMMIHFGWDGKKYSHSYWTSSQEVYKIVDGNGGEIAMRNDEGKSFSEIADWLEEWGL